MKSSKIEKLFDFKPDIEDTKTLSPLTFYQPFQSTFDPDFTSSPPQVSNHSCETPITKWYQGFEKQSNDSSSWDDDQRVINGSYSSGGNDRISSNFRNFGSMVSPTALNLDNDFGRRSLLGMSHASSSPSLLSVNTDQSFERSFFGQKHSVRNVSGFGTVSSLLTNSSNSSSPTARSLRGGLPWTGFDSNFVLGSPLGQTTQSPSSQEGTPVNPYYYPFMLSGRNISQKLQKIGHNRPMICNFCRNNKEVPDIYLNHYLYDPETKVLTCPVLRKHVCEICGGTGDHAHTLQYCPLNRGRGFQAKVPVLLKARTITNSTGKIRRN